VAARYKELVYSGVGLLASDNWYVAHVTDHGSVVAGSVFRTKKEMVNFRKQQLPAGLHVSVGKLTASFGKEAKV